jgi:Fe2+ transport system protein FeoA
MKPGEKGKITKVGGAGVSRRVMDMGMVAGAQVEMERVAPLGDPVEVKVKGYHLTLRKEEAAGVMVEVE